MSICKDDKSYLKNNLISFLTSVKEKLLYTECHEIPCNRATKKGKKISFSGLGLLVSNPKVAVFAI